MRPGRPSSPPPAKWASTSAASSRQRRGESPLDASRPTNAHIFRRAAVIDVALLEKLKSYDTPTICNALEIVDPARRLTGFTTKPLVCPFPHLPPIVGYAKTATIRTTHAHELDAKAQRGRDRRVHSRHRPVGT